MIYFSRLYIYSYCIVCRVSHNILTTKNIFHNNIFSHILLKISGITHTLSLLNIFVCGNVLMPV